ncbi:hypothetical protein [Nocardia gipuzkoensis]
MSQLISSPIVPIQRDPVGESPTPSLDDRYREALRIALESGDFRNAAELLNGFNRADILSRLAQLNDEQVGYLHLGALSNPVVGADSQLAELTRPGAPRASTVGPNSSRISSAAPRSTPGAASEIDVAAMTGPQKLEEAFHRADINAAVREKILAVMTPEALALAISSFVVVFAASQLTPVGWAADITIGLTAVFLGTALFRAAHHLVNFAEARNATTAEQLDAAGREFARAVAEIEVDAILFLVMRAAGGGPRGGAPYSGPPSGGVMLATSNGQFVVVAAETIPAAVAGQLGITAGATVFNMAGGDPRDPHYWEDKYGDDAHDELPRRQRISDGNKQELEDSAWLRRRLPDDRRRREFMKWLERGHNQGERHTHLRPDSREAEAAVREFEAENR